MSSTNKTTNYELSQFIGSDKPAWLVDYNGDMSKIDNQMKANADAASSAASQASSAATAASGAADGVQALNTQINGAGGIASDLVTVQGNINTINSLIGNGEPTTQDKTIIGAINEIAAEIPSGEIAADHVTYDNTSSQLAATTVQGAIDEVNGKFATLEGDDVAYDNTQSGLAATNVQAAIDELAQGGAGADYQDVVITKNVSGTTGVQSTVITTEVTTGAPSGYTPSHAIQIAAAGQATVANVALASDDNWYVTYICGGSSSVDLSITMRYVKTV